MNVPVVSSVANDPRGGISFAGVRAMLVVLMLCRSMI